MSRNVCLNRSRDFTSVARGVLGKVGVVSTLAGGMGYVTRVALTNNPTDPLAMAFGALCLLGVVAAAMFEDGVQRVALNTKGKTPRNYNPK